PSEWRAGGRARAGVAFASEDRGGAVGGGDDGRRVVRGRDGRAGEPRAQAGLPGVTDVEGGGEVAVRQAARPGDGVSYAGDELPVARGGRRAGENGDVAPADA